MVERSAINRSAHITRAARACAAALAAAALGRRRSACRSLPRRARDGRMCWRAGLRLAARRAGHTSRFRHPRLRFGQRPQAGHHTAHRRPGPLEPVGAPPALLGAAGWLPTASEPAAYAAGSVAVCIIFPQSTAVVGAAPRTGRRPTPTPPTTSPTPPTPAQRSRGLHRRRDPEDAGLVGGPQPGAPHLTSSSRRPATRARRSNC